MQVLCSGKDWKEVLLFTQQRVIRTSTRSKCVIHYVFSFQFTHAQHSDRITQGTLGGLKKQAIAENLF